MYFTISKHDYIKHIKESFPDQNKLLDAVRLDCHRMTVTINGKLYDNYLDLIETVNKKYSGYIDLIMLLCNQNAHHYYYEKVHNVLAKQNIYLVSNSDTLDKHDLQTSITILPIVKQITLKNTYQAITISSEQIEVLKTINITLVIDLVLLDDIVVKIDYI